MRHEVKDWLMSGDYAALQAFLDSMDTRIYALERGRVGAQTQVALACLQVLVERYTVVTLFDTASDAARDHAAVQLRRVAAAICKLYGLDPPAWSLGQDVERFGNPQRDAEGHNHLNEAAPHDGGSKVLHRPNDEAEDD